MTHHKLSKRVDALKRAGVEEEDIKNDSEVGKITSKILGDVHEVLWRVSRFDVEDTVRKVVKVVTSESGAPQEVLQRRCDALHVLGSIFQQIMGWRHPKVAESLPCKELHLPKPNLAAFVAVPVPTSWQCPNTLAAYSPWQCPNTYSKRRL